MLSEKQHLVFKENKNNLKISFERIAFIFFIFFIIFILFSTKIIHLSSYDIPQKKIKEKKQNFRSTIIDREGDIIAKSVRVINLKFTSFLEDFMSC